MDWGIIGTVVALVALAVGAPPCLQMFCGKPCVRLSFAETDEPDAKLLMGRLDNPVVKNKFLKWVGVRRNGIAVFVQFDVQVHGTNQMVVSHFRPVLTRTTSSETGISLVLEPPLPLVFTVVQHSANGAQSLNDAPGLNAAVNLVPGEYYATISVGCHDGVLKGRRSLTVGQVRQGTYWSNRSTPPL
jgi:hypothetical protein